MKSRILWRWTVQSVLLVACVAVASHQVRGQGGLRESLERLDIDQDGKLDSDEITPLARPFIERIARARRLSLDRPVRIDSLQEAARVYFAIQNGISDDRVRYEGEKSIKTFELEDDDPVIPEFGLPFVKYATIKDDLDEAEDTLRRNDRNRDGFIDRDEAARSRWTHRNPFEMDLNKDDRLSRLELAQRYARRRLLSDSVNELMQKSRRTGNDISPSESDNDRDDRYGWWRRSGSRAYLASSVIDRFDLNRNGRLESNEAKDMGFPTSQIDVNRDNEVTREELEAFLADKQTDSGDESEGVPGWFYELDSDQDAQVAMSEFTDEWTPDKLQEFAALDRNDDGLLTRTEVAQSKAMMGGSYRNSSAEMLPPRKTIISEIEVTDDFVIGDLNVQLSITHSNVEHLDAHLTGPGGERIELFTEIGGRGNNFEETVFDDEAERPIIKAQPPYQGNFQPEGRSRGQPGLSSFNGQNATGVWQLVIRGTRSDRFGVLHDWSLVFRPRETLLDKPAVAAADSE